MLRIVIIMFYADNASRDPGDNTGDEDGCAQEDSMGESTSLVSVDQTTRTHITRCCCVLLLLFILLSDASA